MSNDQMTGFFFLVLIACGSAYNSYPFSFYSNAPSCNLNMTGLLIAPAGITGVVPTIVLIASSTVGVQINLSVPLTIPTYEVTGSAACSVYEQYVATFKELAEYYVARGYAVLRYDRRTCTTDSSFPGCTYINCDQNNINSSCINIFAFTVNDFVIDATNAIQAILADFPHIVNRSDITLMGHMEGGSALPYISLNFANPPIKNIVMLMSYGKPVDAVFEEQSSNGINLYQKVLPACPADPTTYPEKGVKNFFVGELQENTDLYNQTANFYYIETPGYYNGSELVFIGGLVTVDYWRSWLKWGNASELQSVLTQVANAGTKVSAINSPQDPIVPPDLYQPLHNIITALPNKMGSVSVVDGVYNYLNPSDFSSPNVSSGFYSTLDPLVGTRASVASDYGAALYVTILCFAVIIVIQ